MAGSIGHVIHDGKYTGFGLLENSRDLVEAVEEFAFVLLMTTTEHQRKRALALFHAACRGEAPFPEWWQPDPKPDGDWLPHQRRKNKP